MLAVTVTVLRERLRRPWCSGSEPRSEEGQVQWLLQDAWDPEKLCAMYAGWAAWVCAGNQSESIRCAEAWPAGNGVGRRRITRSTRPFYC